MSDNTVYPISSDGSAPTSNNKATYVDPNEGIDKQAFLELLVAQLRYQDPMNPMQDRDFIAQMAQISNLEQAQNTARLQRIGQAAGMIGQEVEYLNLDELKICTGTVDKITITDGEPQLVITGPDPHDLTKKTKITATVTLDSLRTILPKSTTADDTDETDTADDTDGTDAADDSASGS